MKAADQLAKLFDEHTAALRIAVEALLPVLAREQLEAALSGLRPQQPAKRSAVKAKAIAHRDLKPAKPVADKTRQRAVMRCRKCGELGFRSDGCGCTHNTSSKSKPSADDSEDEPRGVEPAARERKPVQCTRCHRTGHNARTCEGAGSAPPEERVISHVALVAMLAADRAANDLGDAGGFVGGRSNEPSLIGHTEETRELCPVHGWVGRVAFDREHFACVPVGDPCARCRGNLQRAGAITCRRCSGTGIEPAEVDVPAIPPPAPPPMFVGDHRHRRRSPDVPRAKTTAPKRITRVMLAAGAEGLDAELAMLDELRPKTRADCVDGPRPCPWVSCKHHLALDINDETGSIKLTRPDLEVWEMAETCALDVADRGDHTLEQVGAVMNVTRERLRQLEMQGLQKLRVEPVIEDIGPHAFVDRDKGAA